MARRNRFLASKVTKGGFAFIEGQEVYHARNILRLKPGNKIIIFDKEGNEYEAEILRFHSKEKMEAKILRKSERDVEMNVKIHLILGLCRGKQFEFAIQKCAEIGISSVTPLETEHSIVKADDAAKKIERWERILIDATKQSSRTQIPKINNAITFQELLENPELKRENTLFATISENVSPLRDGINIVKNQQQIYVIIGPEGGFSPGENASAENMGWSLVSLGKRILRVETAAIFLVSVLSYELD